MWPDVHAFSSQMELTIASPNVQFLWTKQTSIRKITLARKLLIDSTGCRSTKHGLYHSQVKAFPELASGGKPLARGLQRQNPNGRQTHSNAR